LKKKKIILNENKEIEIYMPMVVYWGSVKIRIYFPKFMVEREYTIDLEDFTSWLEDNPNKTWQDYLKEKLLPLYDRLAKADKLRRLIEAELT